MSLVAMLCLGAGPAAARVVREPDGRLVGVMGDVAPAAGIQTRLPFAARAGELGSGISLQFHGGPVLHSSSPYLVFWDPAGSLTASFRGLMQRYFTDVAQASGNANSLYSVDRQYTDGTGFADYRQSFDPAAQTILDAQPYPASGGCSSTLPSIPVCITDDEIEGELARLIAAQGLPRGAGANAPIYFVVLPVSVNVCTAPGECASNELCGYHTYFGDGGQDVLYAVLPSLELAPGQDPKGCQWDGNQAVEEPNANGADVAISSLSHEDNETITDPLLNAWYASSNGSEDGDMCSSAGRFDPLNGSDPQAFLPGLGGSAAAGTAYDQLISGDRYYVQGEWSNGTGNCEMSPPHLTLLPGFTSVGRITDAGAETTFDPGSTVSAGGFSSVTWDFGDGSSDGFASGAAARAPVVHAYLRTGIYTVSLTVVDRAGDLATLRRRVDVGSSQRVLASTASARRAGRAGRSRHRRAVHRHRRHRMHRHRHHRMRHHRHHRVHPRQRRVRGGRRTRE